MSVRLPDTIRDRLPYLLSRAYLRQLDLFARHTAAFGISGREYAVMLLLEAHEKLWQSQIAEALGLDRTTVTYLVDGLETHGWAARERDPNDRRAYVISLTAAGQQTLVDIGPAVQRAKAEMLAPLNDTEQEQLRALLVRLNAGTE
ncbi:MarR family winged helix-turn-helix transcriptional regulator [Salinisphaera sp. Q1T1-3]|uniref:MarR family winged helix-turn-helix transcriptional regulator n=1 Tax=Salinisphaera sp. Q1T1-3 TaxID=2321229 RepID=UPI000E75009D|nr:MarR family transcriptional regulator [Salinisphaera sp. Q1T1-3]RJS94054.1 MarR family transcriptional regulator [Salinisphaera sp. Q1T1-3]